MSVLSYLSVCNVGVLWPNSWMDQDETWHVGSPQPRPHCVRWGPSSLFPKGAQPPPQFVAHICCGPVAGWIMMPLGTEVNLGPCDVVLDVVAAPPPLKRHSPQFSAHVYCGQTAGWMKTSLGTEVDLGPGHIVLDVDPAPPRERGTAAPLFSAHVYCGHGHPSQLLLSSCPIV